MNITMKVFLLLVFFITGADLLFSTPIEVDRYSRISKFEDSIKYIDAERGEYTVYDIIEKEDSVQWSTPPENINFPIPSSPKWVYFDVKNVDSVRIEKFLILKNPNMNRVALYKYTNNSVVDSVIAGEDYTFDHREIPYPHLLYQLEFDPGQTIRLFMLLDNQTDEIYAPLYLTSPKEFVSNDLIEQYSAFFKAGILFFVVFGTLILLLLTRSKASLYFLIYLVSISFLLLSFWGISQQFLWSNWDFMGTYRDIFADFLAIGGLSLFLREFLSIKKFNGVARITINILIITCFSLLGLSLLFVIPVYVFQVALIFILGLFSIALLIVSVFAHSYSPRESKYVIASLIPIAFAVTLFTLRLSGYKLFSNSLLFGIDTAIVLQMLVLMFGLVDKYRVNQKTVIAKQAQTAIELEKQKSELVLSNDRLKDSLAENEQMQEKLLQVQKLETIGNLAGGIAHDFNNLLMPIIGYAEMGKDDVDKDSPVHENFSYILQSSLRAKDLVSQILSYSKHFNEQRENVNVYEILNEVKGMIQSVIPSTINIVISAEEKDFFVEADATQIHQIFMNICTNAYHAIGEKNGTISISLASVEKNEIRGIQLEKADSRFVQINIEDTGKGMDKEVQKRVFDPFFSTKSKEKGTGLGLSVVYNIIKKSGGDITVNSVVGKGTTFSVFLPLTGQNIKKKAVEEVLIEQGNGELIVLVDDNVAVLEMLEKLLQRNNYTIERFSESDKALSFITENITNVSLLITDQIMSQIKGNELAQAVKQLNNSLPVILITGYSETVSLDNYSKYGIDSLLLKPVDPSELLENVQRLIQ